MEIQLRGRQQAAQQVPIHRRLRSDGGSGNVIVITMMLHDAVDGGALERWHVGEELHLQLGLSRQAAVVMRCRRCSSSAAAVHQ